ncbi:MAG: hypothetical protein LBG60_08725 [Bifidobacteriaceae bacterium]|jgi:hypothetical protein|nr:hypothetical protein [Bifidobacteriaceae bacterium]
MSARFGRIARPAQKAVERAVTDTPGPGLVIVEAPMGEGKTEAAVVAAEIMAHRWGLDGLFVGMPTPATSDPMLAHPVNGGTHRPTLHEMRRCRSARTVPGIRLGAMSDPSWFKRPHKQPARWPMRNRDFRAEFDPEVVALADRGLETRNATLTKLMDGAGLGLDSTWEMDLAAGSFIWRGSKGNVVSPLQVLGTRHPADESWLWAWANHSLPPACCVAAASVREFGLAQQIRPLTTGQLDCGDEQKWMLGNIAIGLGLGDFVYLGDSGRLEIHLLLTDPQVV